MKRRDQFQIEQELSADELQKRRTEKEEVSSLKTFRSKAKYKIMKRVFFFNSQNLEIIITYLNN